MMQKEQREQKIVVTISGSDKVGIVAKITATLAQCQVNIEDIRQTIMQGHFVMLMLCDISKSPKPFKEIKEEITTAGKSLEMEVWIQRKEIFDSMHTLA
ncbi:hypothetical protein tpqmel_0794 [Candidatus Gastranaerophilus sp. (ex Termes propinquus)]|nr:hypothetical protein tpqmel_0794 [Candidatus Gastranaerophilus sp. (ex Termes propinquus)]